MRYLRTAGFTLLMVSSMTAAAETAKETTGKNKVHRKVQQALDWQLPTNKCKQPKLAGIGADVSTPDGSTERYDVDTVKLERYKRKERRWTSCVVKYKKGLLDEFETLKDSAQYGLTQEQADTILGKMKLIQTVLASPTGEQPTEVQ